MIGPYKEATTARGASTALSPLTSVICIVLSLDVQTFDIGVLLEYNNLRTAGYDADASHWTLR